MSKKENEKIVENCLKVEKMLMNKATVTKRWKQLNDSETCSDGKVPFPPFRRLEILQCSYLLL